MSNSEDKDWFVACSDEEKYTSTGSEKGKLKWTPEPEIMIQLFEQIDKGQKEGNTLYLTESNLNLEWKCPGRRPPTPSDDSDMDDEESIDDAELKSRLKERTGRFYIGDKRSDTAENATGHMGNLKAWGKTVATRARDTTSLVAIRKWERLQWT